MLKYYTPPGGGGGGGSYPYIIAPTSLSLVEGYSNATIGPFRIIDDNPVSININAPSSDFVWDSNSYGINVSDGLESGSYPINITATSISGTSTIDYSINIYKPNYYSYYIKIDNAFNIIECMSIKNGEQPEENDWILIEYKGISPHFKALPNANENEIFTSDRIPLYKWDGYTVQQRSENEIYDDSIYNISLLKNNYFLPETVINTQDKTIYTGNSVPNIDEWITFGGGNSIELTEEGMKISNFWNAQTLSEGLSIRLRGRRVTASINVVYLEDGGNASLYLFSISSNLVRNRIIFESYTTLGIFSKTVTIPDDCYTLQFIIGNDNGSGSAVISCCELEIGEVSTLKKPKESMLIQSNPSILDNNWFLPGNIINQGKQITITNNNICIDRWELILGTISITDYGLYMVGCGLSQYIPEEKILWLRGKQVTASVEIIATNGIGSMLLSLQSISNTGVSIDLIKIRKNDSGMMTESIIIPNDCAKLRIIISNEGGCIATISRCDLELGNTSTLTNKLPPDYGVELAKCQRYRIGYKDNMVGTQLITVNPVVLQCLIPTPVTLKSNPTLISGVFDVHDASGSIHTGFRAAYTAEFDGIYVRLYKDGPPNVELQPHGLTAGACILFYQPIFDVS